MNQKNKILIVSEVFYPESGLINDFVLELQNRGYSVDILTQHPSYPESVIFTGYKNEYFVEDNYNNSKIFRFKFIEGYKNSLLRKILNYTVFVTIGKKIAIKIGQNYDHILIYQTGPLTVSLPAIAIKNKFKTKISIWSFDIWPDTVYAYGFPSIFPLNYILNRFIKKVYTKCDNIFVSSKNFIESIQKFVPNKQIIYAPNWMPQEPQVESSLILNKNLINFTFTGNISKSQNLRNVLLGWKRANISKKAVLNIVGSGSFFNDLKKIIENESIEGVILHGRFPSNQIINILNQSDVLILSLASSRGIEKTEPFKIQSYLSAKKPIFGILAGAGKDIIIENELGLCADPNDLDDICYKFRESITFARKNSSKVLLNSAYLLESRFNRNNIINQILSAIFK